MNSFTIYKEYYDLISLLSEKEQQELLYSIAKYMFEDIQPKLNDRQIKIFNNLKRPLDKSKEQSKRRTNQEPNENQKETKQKPNRNQIETKQEPKGQPKENTSNDVNVNVNVNVNNIFKKPKLEEIKEYCIERNNNINPENFYDFYESKNWMVGKNKMKDWKACIRTWEQRNNNKIPEWVGKKIQEEKVSQEEQKELEEIIKKYEEE